MSRKTIVPNAQGEPAAPTPTKVATAPRKKSAPKPKHRKTPLAADIQAALNGVPAVTADSTVEDVVAALEELAAGGIDVLGRAKEITKALLGEDVGGLVGQALDLLHPERQLLASLPEKVRAVALQAAGLSDVEYDLQRQKMRRDAGLTTVKALDRLRQQLRALADDATDEEGDGRSLAARVITMVKERASLAHDEDSEVYVITNGQPQMVFGLDAAASKTSQFRRWVSYVMYETMQLPLTDEIYTTVHGTLATLGLHGGPLISVHLRVAYVDGKHYLDLCDKDWRVVEVDATGWRVLTRSPVYFRRTAAMHALPVPAPGADIDEIWGLINVAPEDRTLFLAWELDALRPQTPYPVLSLQGPEGSGKTSVAVDARTLIDPHKAPTRGLGEKRDVQVAAVNNHVCAWENVSSIDEEVSDTLCRIASGSGMSERQLYTNLDEVVVAFKRPQIIEGIPFLLRQPDIIDRAVHLGIPRLSQRVEPEKYAAAWQSAHPRLLGALLDLFAGALAVYDKVIPTIQSRMLSYVHLGMAVHAVLGDQRDFSALLADRQDAVRMKALESSPFVSQLVVYLTALARGASVSGDADATQAHGTATCQQRFSGTMGQLVDAVTANTVSPATVAAFPRSPQAASNLVQRHMRVLKDRGVTVVARGHVEEGSWYEIWRDLPVGTEAPPPSPEGKPARRKTQTVDTTFDPPDRDTQEAPHFSGSKVRQPRQSKGNGAGQPSAAADGPTPEQAARIEALKAKWRAHDKAVLAAVKRSGGGRSGGGR